MIKKKLKKRSMLVIMGAVGILGAILLVISRTNITGLATNDLQSNSISIIGISFLIFALILFFELLKLARK